MKRLLIIAVGAALLQGCVSTTFEKSADGTVKIVRDAKFYPFKTGGFEIPGVLTVLDYDTDGGIATTLRIDGSTVTNGVYTL